MGNQCNAPCVLLKVEMSRWRFFNKRYEFFLQRLRGLQRESCFEQLGTIPSHPLERGSAAL